MINKPDYIICKYCTHTVNIHNEEGVCEAYKCSCTQYEENSQK